jgi:hypothetical protein
VITLAGLDCCQRGCDDRLDVGDTGWAAHLGLDGTVRIECPACAGFAGGPAATEPGAPVRLHPNEAALIAVLRNAQRRRIRHRQFKASHRAPQHQARIDASGKELGERLSRAGRLLQHIIANPPDLEARS